MPSTQVVKTPAIIQRAWNDGLFLVRERRGGNARGATIEEKCMYVLGMGWKHNGTSEIKDNEIENTLFISLQGLTQESKFLKIGQVLWEECSEDFILKMISSLSTNTKQQTKLYESIANKESKNFKGYFSKYNANLIKRNNINPSNILNRESRQMSSNANLNRNYKNKLDQQRRDYISSRVSSKGFEKKIVRFKPTSEVTKKLSVELEYILKNMSPDEVGSYAISLGIDVESGYNKNYLVEEIKSVVCAYVEFELLQNRYKGNNVYLRPDVAGLDTIKKLIRMTSFGLLASDDILSVDELKKYTKDINTMRQNMSKYLRRSGDLNQKKLDKDLEAKEYVARLIEKRENTRDRKSSYGGVKYNYKVKFKASDARKLFSFLETHFSTTRDNTSGLYVESRSGDTILKGLEAVTDWISMNQNDVLMSKNISGNDILNDSKANLNHKLIFSDYTNDDLLIKTISVAKSMGITNEDFLNIDTNILSADSANLYMAAILRRFNAMSKRIRGFNPFKKARRKRALDAIEEKIARNEAGATASRENMDKLFAVENGVHKPVGISPAMLKDLYGKMQGVYVVGGSIYSFNVGSTITTTDKSGSTKITDKINTRRNILSKLRGRGGDVELARMIKDKGFNPMAFGTPENSLIIDREADIVQLRRVIEAKITPSLKGILNDKTGLKLGKTLQPVFVVNKGLNTSNVEMTALLNLLPSVLEAIPMFGGFASSLMEGVLADEINSARNLVKFARGGSFTTKNTNISQFISGDSINNRVNPEKITIDWVGQRVNVQPLTNTSIINNNVTNVEKGKITNPIIATPSTVKVNGKSGQTEAMSVYNAVNPFEESVKVGDLNASPMEVLLSLKESLMEILSALIVNNQTEQTHASITAKVVDAINNLNNNMGSNSSGSDLFSPIIRLAKGE